MVIYGVSKIKNNFLDFRRRRFPPKIAKVPIAPCPSVLSRDKRNFKDCWDKGKFLENRNRVKFLGKKKKNTVIFVKLTAIFRKSTVPNVPLSSKSSVPKNGSSVPKNGSSVPKNESSVPKNGSSVPKNGSSVPKNGSSVPKNENSVPKNENSVAKDGSSVAKNESSVKFNTSFAVFPKNFQSIF
jgi:hypothetical protein